VRDAHGGHVQNRAEVEREAGAARVVAASSVDEQEIGSARESPDGRLQQRPFAEGKQARLVGRARRAPDDHRLVADGGSGPRRVARGSGPGRAALETDEAAADMVGRPAPRRRRCTREPLLLGDQFLRRVWPEQHGPHTRAVKLALAGDTMLGRKVAEALRSTPPAALVDRALVDALHEADLVVLNLECCISERGERWPDPRKPFFFRAPPRATELLGLLGVDCVTLANNHALDYGREALLDTLEHLRTAGIPWVGAGPDVEAARAPAVLTAAAFRLAVVGVTDHPADYAAGDDEPGVAYADLRSGPPGWLLDTVAGAEADAVLVTPHWGPNMTTEPSPEARAAAAGLLNAGATLIAGHSAHVFHGVEGRTLYDLGDFLDDYRVDAKLRNDLGLLFLVTLERDGPTRLEALPLKLDFCRTRLADGEDAAWIRRRFRAACAALHTEVREENGRLVIGPFGGWTAP
jgi:poly-gamma-glutamate capsule biosynthesis protein CapA/YwtB (metallophosphatase superfamily)